MKIADIMTTALRMNRQNNSFFSTLVVSSTFTASFTFESRLDRWNVVNLDFFNSIYDEKIIATTKFVQHANKNTYFRDVHLFIERAKYIVLVKKTKMIENNLYICFREQIMMWYAIKILNENKKLVKIENNLNVWEKYLIKRFRERSNVIMTTIIKKKYIMKNARRRRESREYADIIMKAAKSAKLESNEHIIMLIYNDLDLKFQRDIFLSELITRIQNFLQSFDDKKNIWWKLTQRNLIRNSYYEDSQDYNQFRHSYIQHQAHHQSNADYFSQTFDQYDFQNNNQWKSINFYRFFYQFESANQSNQIYSQTQSNERQLKASRLKLQIIANSSNEFVSFFKWNSFRLNDNSTFRIN